MRDPWKETNVFPWEKRAVKEEERCLIYLKTTNEWNEKAIVGFVAFAIMVLVMIADTVSGAIGKDLSN